MRSRLLENVQNTISASNPFPLKPYRFNEYLFSALLDDWCHVKPVFSGLLESIYVNGLYFPYLKPWHLMDSNCNEPFVTKWYYPAMTKRSKSGIARLWSARCVGRVHGIWTSGGCNCGCFSKCHRCGSVRWKRSWIKKWWGGSPSHPICSMHLRNRWSVVECKIHLHLCVNWIQKDQILEEWGNLHLGRKKFILETASAVVLSDNMEIRMGIRDPGKYWEVMYTEAIWASVLRLAISFWRLSWTGICNQMFWWVTCLFCWMVRSPVQIANVDASSFVNLLEFCPGWTLSVVVFQVFLVC